MIGSKQVLLAALFGINISTVLSKALNGKKASSAAILLKQRVSLKALRATEKELVLTLTDQTTSETTWLNNYVNATAGATYTEDTSRNSNSSLATSVGSIRGAHIHDVGLNEVSEQDGLMEQLHVADETIKDGIGRGNTDHGPGNNTEVVTKKGINATADNVQAFEYADEIIIMRPDPTNHSRVRKAGLIRNNSKLKDPVWDGLSLDAVNGQPQQDIDVQTNTGIIGSPENIIQGVGTQGKNLSQVDNIANRTKENVTEGGNGIDSRTKTDEIVGMFDTGGKGDPQDYKTQTVHLNHKRKGENATYGDDEAFGYNDFEEAVVISRPGPKGAFGFSSGAP